MQFKEYPMPTKNGSDSSGPSSFLKMSDGESKRGVLRGEIFEFFNRWEGGKSFICEPNEPGAKRRFKVNFITEENGGLVAKVWEFGILVYNQLKDINEEYPLEQTKIKVTRDGTGKDTSYMILPLLTSKDKITQKQMEKILAIDLLTLSKPKNYAPQTTEVPERFSDDSGEPLF